ncbi:hypothetical protein MARA_33810 [Mycolicibacterium arabiense]|uniref:Uncharacterized protein n=1 Tax=Mycolicibacterium arabiense TaxID=1286181 RepID=A0A7I7RZN8_9MYCO|nr:hypothetical protein [Mycolicibacterium arabiense]MCV7371218.1 hypothetical protein [Mycolicibacterium arabiense]BBY49913.1 hypothetical protein MARA_33810 [Mycolicibacterium arabiense]
MTDRADANVAAEQGGGRHPDPGLQTRRVRDVGRLLLHCENRIVRYGNQTIVF